MVSLCVSHPSVLKDSQNLAPLGDIRLLGWKGMYLGVEKISDILQHCYSRDLHLTHLVFPYFSFIICKMKTIAS